MNNIHVYFIDILCTQCLCKWILVTPLTPVALLQHTFMDWDVGHKSIDNSMNPRKTFPYHYSFRPEDPQPPHHQRRYQGRLGQLHVQRAKHAVLIHRRLRVSRLDILRSLYQSYMQTLPLKIERHRQPLRFWLRQWELPEQNFNFGCSNLSLKISPRRKWRK